MSSPAASSAKPHTGWEDLPTEIKLAVLNHLRDLGSLGTLFHASPSFYRACGSNARKYTEAILQSGAVCGHTAVLFRLCAMLRSGTLPVHSNERFYALVTGEAMCYFNRIRESRRGIAPRNLEDLDPVTIRTLLVTARHIGNLAGECLQFYLKRFKTLRPEVPASEETSRAEVMKGSGIVQHRRPVKVEDLFSFEWDEEQRAIRAIWRVQLIYELKQAVLVKKRLHWEDPKELESIPAIAPPTGSNKPNCFYKLREAKRFLQWPNSFYGLRYHYQDYIEPVSWATGHTEGQRFDEIRNGPEYEEMNSVAEFINEKYGEDAARVYRDGHLCIRQLHHTVPDTIPVPTFERKDWKKLIYASPAVDFYFEQGPSNPGDPPLPFYNTNFDYFAGFGLAFWSEIRLMKYGLASSEDPMPWTILYHAWNSVSQISN